jgi:hydrogenase nickel incorporation protein HypA/HybF
MHEFSIASSIVEKVSEFAERQGVSRIVEVRLLIGELTCVEHEQLRFCFQAITKDSALEDSALEIDTIPATVRCPRCAYEGPPKYWDEALAAGRFPTMECPGCGHAAEAVAGHDCAIKSIKYVRDSDTADTELSPA